MADSTLTALPAGTPTTATLLYGVISGNSRKFTVADLPVLGQLSSATLNDMVRWGAGGTTLKDSAFWNTTDTGVSTILGTTAASPGLYVGIAGDTVARISLGINASDNARIGMGAGGAGARDTFLTRKAAATFRLGAEDAASPVEQSLAVQSVVAGTSNTAGANVTFMGSQGTGTGAGGSFLFQTAAAGLTGSTQNALATVLTVNSAGQTLVADGTAALPSMSFISDPDSGMLSVSANVLGFSVGTNTRVTMANSSSSGLSVGSGMGISWASNAAPTGLNADAIMSRKGAANIRYGASDVAAPVAQTLSVQGVVAGTSNTAGANWTFQGSQSTGTGAGGSIIFQTSPAGSTSSTQNAFATALTINSAGQSLFAAGTASLPSISWGGDPNSGFYSASDNNPRLSINGGDNINFTTSGPNIDVAGRYAWGSSGVTSADLFLTRKAAATLRLGAADAAAPVAQTLSVQSVVAGTTDTAGADLTIAGSQGTGTGVGGRVVFQTAIPSGSTGTAQNALSNTFIVANSGGTTVAASTATPAGGSTSARLLFGTTAGFGIYYGSGAPSSLTAGQGSIYLNSAGSGIADRLYVNTTGSTTWTNFVSAA